MYLRILYDVDMYISFNFFPYIHFCHQKSNEMIIIIKALGKKPQNYNFGESCKAKNSASSSKDKKKCQHLHCTSLLNIHCSHQKVVEAAEL